MRKDYFWVRIKRKILGKVWLSRSLLILGVISFLILIFYNINRFIDFSVPRLYLNTIGNFLSPRGIKTINERVNILILGKSSKDHAGGELTDTIIFSSISIKDKGIVLVSIPRDVWISEIRAKINSAYFWGNQKKIGGGLVLAKSTVEQILNQQISYAVVLDFDGFKNMIDAVGGIEVKILNSFVDERYPIAGREDDLCGGDKSFSCRYEKIEFKQGVIHMDGETALKFVRSRNAKGDEGTDIARGKRQEQIIFAFRDKLLSSEFLFSPKKIRNLINVITESIETDFNLTEASGIARYVLKNRQNVKNYAINEEFLLNPPVSEKYDKLYVFVPKAGDWGQLQKWIQSLLN